MKSGDQKWPNLMTFPTCKDRNLCAVYQVLDGIILNDISTIHLEVVAKIQAPPKNIALFKTIEKQHIKWCERGFREILLIEHALNTNLSIKGIFVYLELFSYICGATGASNSQGKR